MSGNPGGAGSRKGERKAKREEDYQAENHLLMVSICLANWRLRSTARMFPSNLSKLAVGFHSSNCSNG